MGTTSVTGGYGVPSGARTYRSMATRDVVGWPMVVELALSLLRWFSCRYRRFTHKLLGIPLAPVAGH